MIRWMKGFASQLAAAWRLNRGNEIEIADSSDRLFFQELIRAVRSGNGDRKIVHQFLDKNLDRLDATAVESFSALVKEFLAGLERGRASSINNLAIDLRQFPRGNRSVNLELAIVCYRLALEVITRDAYPEQWAMTQNNLATAYGNRIQGDRDQNIEETIACYRLALEVITRDAYPEDWAMMQNNLACTLETHIRGDRDQNIEEAIACYRLALKVYTRDAYPKDWAMTQNNLAGALQTRSQGELSVNLEESIECYRLALEVRTREAYPEQWAITQTNLACVLRNRIQGDRAVDLEESIGCYKLLLDIYTREAFPDDWAITNMNLAGALQTRIRGELSMNLEESITCCRMALEVYTRDAYPEQWAMTQIVMACALGNRIQSELSVNLEESIDGYHLVLEVYTRDAYPREWAMTQNNLGMALQNRIQGELSINLEESIDRYHLVLEVYTRNAYPREWAMTQNNLGMALISVDQLDDSIECFQSALEIYTAELLPLNCLRTARNLGNLFFKLGEWQLAISAYDRAIQAVETSRSWATSDASRQELLSNSLSVYKNAIQSAVNLGNYQLAIQYTERVRSRQLVELMESKDLYNNAEISPEIQQYLYEYETLNHQIQALRERSNDSDDTKGQASQTAHRFSRDDLDVVTKDIRALEAQKQIIYKKIRAKDRLLAESLAVDPIEWAQIQSLITSSKTAILTYYSTDDDTHIFILKQGQEPQLFTCTGQGYKELQLWLQKSWSINDPNWRSRMPSILADIAQRLQLRDLVNKHLEDIEELIILPHLYLHQIPFAALPLTAAAKGEVLGDKFVIRSIPSCQILKYCVDRDPITKHTYGTVEDADGSLFGARYEGEQIAHINQIHTDNRLRGQTQATKASYLKLLARVTRLHSSHHAASRLDNPLESALKLADGSITLGDLLLGRRYPNLDEVFLSACETHVGKTTLTDDVTTLNTAFLCIGARSVQSTLWSVDDLVTALFDIFYHQFRQGGMNRAIALQQAQIRLRNLSGDEFKLNHHPQLSAYFSQQIVPYITKLERQITDLSTKKLTVTGEEEKKIRGEIDELERRCDRANSIEQTLENYCEKSRPFRDPYYWAAFITQGMA